MRDKLEDLLQKLQKNYKEVAAYIFFGICTTIANIVVYWAAARLLGIPTVPSTVLAWIAAVLVAYLTNRKWVFHSEAVGAREILQEAARFVAARLATGVFDWVFMYIAVDLLHQNDVIMKVVANVVVVICNYILSKTVIFRKKKKEAVDRENGEHSKTGRNRL